MIRHISIFTFKNSTPDGKSKADNISSVRRFLQTVPAMNPSIIQHSVCIPALDSPDLPDEAPVMFGDLIQIADFTSIEDAQNYPASEAHIKLTEFSSPMLRKVTAIDFEI